MIMRSTKSTVSQSTLCLSCETLMSVRMNASDNAAETAGRRRTASQNPFRVVQVRKNAVLCSGPHSVQTLIAIAARWISAMLDASTGVPRNAARAIVQQRVTNEKMGDMAVNSCPAMMKVTPGAQPECYSYVLNVSWSCHNRLAEIR